ncbi:uncharacterized protein BO97DRAFT_403352 [Aspergillus homomorphus CBS 101889]|uniref:Uncharacterized protein n=1 Tax=Aspergillus homomorphus (strain CBS 101889) TaxID=1450537 RepID=A0A395I5I9_ASPHC|nr:hypothetical protein BO97DRAFT_403352 [Aspergillus homomorphus CBS 101889]RAL15350.1 hypothetical protein BO97DRAFT_403352 [Aspergillus homomorphus CBS 101889]
MGVGQGRAETHSSECCLCVGLTPFVTTCSGCPPIALPVLYLLIDQDGGILSF